MTAMLGKVALVTGGTSGIGRAAALAFAREGAKVVVSGRRETEGREVAAEIGAAGGNAIFIRTDVASEPDVQALIARSLAAFGRLDCAFNNAGTEGNPSLFTHEQTVENYHAIMTPNVLGVLLSMKHEIPALLESGGGAIVNNASVGGVIGFPGAGPYVASKHAVIGLTKSAALEYAAQGVRVNAVGPGGVETPMLDRFTGGPGTDFHDKFSAMHPIGRTGRPAEIADVVVWLCSDKSSFVTGQTILADGGWTAQ